MGSILDSQDQKDLQEDQPDFTATSGPLYHMSLMHSGKPSGKALVP